MFEDRSFFASGRSGILENRIPYPSVLDPASEDYANVFGGLPDITRALWNFSSSENHFIEAGEDLLIIPDMSAIVQRPRNLIRVIKEIRKRYGFSKLIYAQGFSDPYLIPVLVYLGISFFDNTQAILEGADGIRYTPFGRIRNGEDNSESNSEYVSEIARFCGLALEGGKLRELVERATVSSRAVEILRLSDDVLYNQVESGFPRYTPSLIAGSIESLNRPDLRRFRSYISEEYKHQYDGQIALLIPCTARKPYSTSRTHQRLLRALGNRRKNLHEIIVTSPVGLVPRDLERTYPPAFYDIPVTGQWYLEEQRMINSMLEHYFSRNHYRRVIAFIDESLEFIRDHLPQESEIIFWNKHSGDSEFDLLLSSIDSEKNEQKQQKRNTRLEEFISIAKYQFGDWIVPYVSSSRIIRNYDRDMLVYDGKPALVFHEDRGMFSITRHAAQWFIENSKFLVEIDDFKPTANIYAVGIKGASQEIRPGDEVVLHHSGDVRGVGIAKMPVEAMTSLRKGVAVKVRN
ncbi:MAG: DUF5591 domain-containing protein [Candidatus Thermoplasmatota archaeon]|nr:DUF5591 domain-containing protein [Candidatus Thermoplasmatota archaeon]